MMQTARMLGGVAIVLVSACAVRADPTPAKIMLPEVLVRSGPSPEFYETSKLRKGDAVSVLHEENTGWLAIAPPSGSFSWIDTRLVKQIGPNAAVVSAAEAQVWAGSRLDNREPTVSRTKATKGTQLTVIGKPERARDGMRLPIAPVPAEVRYIPAEAIRPNAAPQQLAAAAPEQSRLASAPTGFAAPGPATAVSAAVPTAASPRGSPSPSAPSGTPNPLWLEAEQAERAGNLVRAQELLQELADQVRQTDFELSTRCINRIDILREQRRNGATNVMAAANANGGTIAGRLTPSPSSEYCYVQDPRYTAKLSPPVMNASTSPPLGTWSDVGRLRRVPFPLDDGRPLFCLEAFSPNQRQMYHMYVAAGPDVKLEPYVERNVILYGPVVYRGDLRTNFMTVIQVRSAR
jgi:hypothetical protein